jgi:hypothetical protein
MPKNTSNLIIYLELTLKIKFLTILSHFEQNF